MNEEHTLTPRRSCPHGIRFPVASSGLELCRQRCAPLAGACLLDEGYAVCVCPSDDELKRGPASASS